MSKIDVHHHVYAPFFTQAINESGGDPSGWYIPEWTLDRDRELCKSIGVQCAILSATAPGPDCKSDPNEAAILARKLNEFNAQIRDSDPDHYGFFASVPSLVYTDLCLVEIKHAFDVLKADGVVLMTCYGSNQYLGHGDFTAIWDELNRRKAVVFVHPTHGVDTSIVNPALPQPMFDYPHETGRAAIDLITSDMLRGHARDCKIILSHAGGTLPMLIGRAAGLLPFSSFDIGKSPEDIYEEASWFYFDTALSSDAGQLAALQRLAKPDHILFGSDFPNAPDNAIRYFTDQLHTSSVLEDEHRAAIDGRAGKKLFPRLA